MSETAGNLLWPTYALRAWLEALSGEIRRAREDLENRINLAEKEVARLRRLHERAGHVIESLQQSISKVDMRLHQLGDIEPGPSVAEHQESPHKSPEHASSESDPHREKETAHKPEKGAARGRGPRG
jgi:2,3-bisphosphoglycerate-independent phosphoglycerate mutase